MVKEKQPFEHWPMLLLNWFQKNRRDLPWRTVPRDPYKVWVSEVMLQQTKVETVEPYYESWLHSFPTVKALAAASQDDVLRQWQGLGYYSRARNLYQAVCEVQEKYGGTVPDTEKEMRALKGVGEYTAGAVLSIAYGKAVPAVDGNVLRIFSRLYLIEENVLSQKIKKEITDLVKAVLPKNCPGNFNEALMDFGALVCIPKTPHCTACPLQDCCQARQAGKEKQLPVRLANKKKSLEEITVIVVSNGLSWLIHRRPAHGLLASMWEFPNALGTGTSGIQSVRELLDKQGVQITTPEGPVQTLQHVFSHKIWHLTVYVAERESGTLMAKEDWQWLPRQQYECVPWAGPFGKIIAGL